MAKRNHTKQTNKSHKKNKAGGVGKQSAAYRMFSTEQRAHRTELKSMSAKEQTKFLGDEWRKLSAQQKQAYHAGPTHHGHGKTKSKSHRSPKTKRGIKHHSHAKKQTKRLGHKSTGQKAAHHAEHNHMEAHETVHHSHE